MTEQSKKMKNCVVCGKEIAKEAKQCPYCGGKNKKPMYKRAWFIVLVGIIAIGVVSSNSGSDKQSGSKIANDTQISSQSNSEQVVDSDKSQIAYTSYDVSQLVEDLEKNAMSAEKKYGGQYVELTGKINVIDSDGTYISLSSQKNEFSLVNVQCYIKNEEQENKVLEMSIGDIITLKGKIKSVGEVLGYSLDITEIN